MHSSATVSPGKTTGPSSLLMGSKSESSRLTENGCPCMQRFRFGAMINSTIGKETPRSVSHQENQSACLSRTFSIVMILTRLDLEAQRMEVRELLGRDRATPKSLVRALLSRTRFRARSHLLPTLSNHLNRRPSLPTKIKPRTRPHRLQRSASPRRNDNLLADLLSTMRMNTFIITSTFVLVC